MFHKIIIELQKARKFVDNQAIGQADNPWISANLNDVSYSLTIAIKDLIRIDKILKKKEQEQ